MVYVPGQRSQHASYHPHTNEPKEEELQEQKLELKKQYLRDDIANGRFQDALDKLKDPGYKVYFLNYSPEMREKHLVNYVGEINPSKYHTNSTVVPRNFQTFVHFLNKEY